MKQYKIMTMSKLYVYLTTQVNLGNMMLSKAKYIIRYIQHNATYTKYCITENHNTLFMGTSMCMDKIKINASEDKGEERSLQEGLSATLYNLVIADDLQLMWASL